MPIFEFECKECDATTERIATFEDREKIEILCPRCHKKMEPVDFSKVAKFQWGKGGSWN